MAEKIVIAELDINVDALLKSSSEVKKSIDELKKAQAELKKQGDTSSEQYVQNASDLKVLNSAYNANIKVLAEATQATANQANQAELISLALQSEAQSIAEAREQNKLLTKIRNETNTSTDEGKKQLKLLNDKLDENNKYIKENADQFLKQKLNIGNYTESVKDALNATGLFGGKLGEASKVLDLAKTAINPLKNDIVNTSKGMKEATASTEGLSVAQKAFAVATTLGTGAVRIFTVALAATGITLIIGAIALLIGYFKTLDPVVDKIEQLMAGLGATVRVVQQALAGLLTLDFSGFSNLSGKINEATKSAIKLKQAQQDLADLQSSQEVANAKASQQYDELILKSKNRTLTEKERIDFINQAQKIEEENFKQRSALADKEIANAIEQARIKGQLSKESVENLKKEGIAYANYLLNAGKITQEEYDGYKKATLGKIQIQAESTKRLEKSQNAEDKLNEDAQKAREKATADQKAESAKRAEIRQKELTDIAEKLKLELDLFLQSQGEKSKGLEADLKQAEFVKNQKLAIAEAEFNATKKTENDILNLRLARNSALEESLQSQAEIIASFSKAEFDLFIAQNQSKLDGVKILNEALVEEERKRILAVNAEKINQLQIEKGVNDESIALKVANNEALTANEIEYQAQRITLENEANKQIEANRLSLAEQLKAQKTAQLKAQSDIDIENAQSQLEADLLQNQARYDAELAQFTTALEQKKLTQDQFDELSRQSKKKQDDLDRLARINSVSDRLNEFQKLGQGLEGLFGKNKAIASATALINGGLAVTEILKTPSTFPEPFASISRGVQIAGAVATTARSVAQINNAKFEKGGIVGIDGNSHAMGGVPIYAGGKYIGEAEGNEGIGILNRSAFSSFMAFNNQFAKGKIGTTYAQNGGIISRGLNTNSLDIQSLAELTANAVSSLPAPVVGIEDILERGQRTVDVRENANF